ncbi:MAG TPA: hypothetical protein VIA06_23765 [Candidatus Dormibacteraeota bacterium]|jgi:hypothetical protein|nr:hypothetical protein [Candidatus Dormibacteraeota bacterium]
MGVAAGRLGPAGGRTPQLDETAWAHAAIDPRAVIGKTPLTVGMAPP